MLRIDLDSYREILDTLTRNKSRSLLTGFGVFWGVFMLVALMGGGQGLKEGLEKNFAGFATNSAMIWAQPTSKAYKGFRKGRYWWMVQKDVQRLRSAVPELDVITPLLFSNGGTAYYQDRKADVGVNGALNAAILAAEMLALGDAEIAKKVANYKENLKNKITKANAELKEVKYQYKTN